MPSEIPTPTINLSKPKYTLGLKPTLIAKPPLDANKSEGVTSGDGSMSIPSDDLVSKASLSPAAANVETTTSEDNAEPTDSGMSIFHREAVLTSIEDSVDAALPFQSDLVLCRFCRG